MDSTGVQKIGPLHSKSALSPLLSVASGRGRDSTRLLELRNFFAGPGLFYA